MLYKRYAEKKKKNKTEILFEFKMFFKASIFNNINIGNTGIKYLALILFEYKVTR